ncbi:MAG: MFS transporter [Chloroflexia bacterium]|nr:MFS transporter [Chloroflexia bacterium]
MTILPLRNKILFAAGGIGGEALNQSRNVWLVYFYAPPEGADGEAVLKLTTVSLLLFAGRFIEAFDDVLIGYWSDRTRSRWGRRIPFIVGAAPLWALFAFLMFVPPEGSSGAMTALYFFVALQMFHLFGTLVHGPYAALQPEIARTSEERVSLAAFSVYFGIGGAAIGLVGSGLLVDRFGFPVMAAMAGLALVTRYIGVAGVWKRVDRAQAPSRMSLRESLKTTFSNTHFLFFLPSFVFFLVGLTMLLGMLPFYVNAILESDNEGTWVAILTGVSIVAMAAAVPLFAWIARRTSKRHAYRVAMLAAALAFPVIALPGLIPGVPLTAQVIIAMAIAGAPVAAVYLFPGPLIADICDDDARKTGERREATFYGGHTFVEKTVGSLAPLMLALVLLLGNSPENPLGVRLVGPVAGLVVFAGYLIFRFYDLPDEGEQVVPVERERIAETLS